MAEKPTWGEIRAKIKEEIAAELKPVIDAAVQGTKDAVEELRKKETEFMARGMARAGNPEKPSPEKLGLNAGRFIRAVANGKGDIGRSAHWAKTVMLDEPLSKALMTSISESGGALVPAGDVQELIEMLRPMSAIRSAGPLVIPMPVGQLTWPAVSSGPTAGYIGEGASQNATGLTLRLVNLVWKKLRALVPLTQELVRMSAPGADAVVRDELAMSLATGEDVAFLRADGTAAQPKGLRYQALAANIFATGSADDGTVPTIGEAESDLRKMLDALEGRNVRMVRPSFFLPSRQVNFLRFLRDTVGFKAFPELSEAAQTLLGVPVRKTNNIPTNLAGAGAQTLSESYLVDMADVIIGESNSIEVSVSNEASFHDEVGNVVSAFDQDLVIIKAIERHDLGVRHPESVCVLTSVLWGAQ